MQGEGRGSLPFHAGYPCFIMGAGGGTAGAPTRPNPPPPPIVRIVYYRFPLYSRQGGRVSKNPIVSQENKGLAVVSAGVEAVKAAGPLTGVEFVRSLLKSPASRDFRATGFFPAFFYTNLVFFKTCTGWAAFIPAVGEAIVGIIPTTPQKKQEYKGPFVHGIPLSAPHYTTETFLANVTQVTRFFVDRSDQGGKLSLRVRSVVDAGLKKT